MVSSSPSGSVSLASTSNLTDPPTLAGTPFSSTSLTAVGGRLGRGRVVTCRVPVASSVPSETTYVMVSAPDQPFAGR